VEVIDRLKLFKLEKSVLTAGKLFHRKKTNRIDKFRFYAMYLLHRCIRLVAIMTTKTLMR